MVRASRLGVLGVLLLATGCSDAGDGGGNDGSWLTIYPASAVVFPPTAAAMTLYATATRTFHQTVYVGIVDAERVTTGEVSLSANSATSFTATLYASGALAPGKHTGTFEIRLCFDDPIACNSPLPGSPWYVPYSIFVVDRAAYSFPAWNEVSTPPFDLFALGTRGSDALAVAVGFYSNATQVWDSSDLGSTWSSVTTASAPPATRHFALATVGTDLYLSGGESMGPYGTPLGSYTSHVWRFDGSAWHELTAAAPFAGRMDHAMIGIGGALYVLGGRDAAGDLSDAWKSVDGGVTWTQIGTPLPVGAGGRVCAVEWNGEILLVANAALKTSSDATAWASVPGYVAPFQISATHCAVLNGRLYLYGLGGGPGQSEGTVSSPDLVSWQFEPSTSYPDIAPGLAAVNGHLLLGLGVKSSNRMIMRSAP
jgi:hypothetical protein